MCRLLLPCPVEFVESAGCLADVFLCPLAAHRCLRTLNDPESARRMYTRAVKLLVDCEQKFERLLHEQEVADHQVGGHSGCLLRLCEVRMRGEFGSIRSISHIVMAVQAAVSASALLSKHIKVAQRQVRWEQRRGSNSTTSTASSSMSSDGPPPLGVYERESVLLPYYAAHAVKDAQNATINEVAALYTATKEAAARNRSAEGGRLPGHEDEDITDRHVAPFNVLQMLHREALGAVMERLAAASIAVARRDRSRDEVLQGLKETVRFLFKLCERGAVVVHLSKEGACLHSHLFVLLSGDCVVRSG